MKNVLGKVSKLKRLVGNFIDSNKDSIALLLRDNFTRDFLIRLRKGEFLISEDFIRYHIEGAAQKEADVELDDVYCSPDGIRIALIVKRYKAKVKVNFCISIKKVQINSKRQIFIFNLKNEKIVGSNISGLFIAAFTETMLAGIITKSVFPEEILKSIHYKKNYTAAIVDLSEIDLMKKLNRPLLNSSKSLLDFVSINKAVHSYRGINIKTRVMGFLFK
ncbi:MAG: hypothetical protein K9L78_00610 [Victivallales bacterium]|nr:hypothetical protein [Victivallales bacterium]MCF7888597.1 hypothetical protein [Victivallales bacterium]